MDLGDYTAAFDELDDIDTPLRAHPDVMKLRWEIYNKADKHGSAFVVAEGLTRLLPNDPQPFIWRAHSVRHKEGGSLHRAMEMLLEVANNFPEEPTFPFNLACYNSQLGNMDSAKAWLHISFEVAERNGTGLRWKSLAMDEPDLAPLRKAFGGI